MAYSVINDNGKIVVRTFEFNKKTGARTEHRQILPVRQARAFARDIYSYCRIAETELKQIKRRDGN